MKVLVVGSGGREHAIAWKLSQSTQVHEVYVAPGNAGSANGRKLANVDIAVDDVERLIDFARRNEVHLTIVGPEAPLVAGIVDSFEAQGLRCFGPRRGAAQLEGSKAFTKAFLARHGIPTAEHRVFTELDEACAYVERMGAPIVVKADGLAAGKGVVLAASVEEAKAAARAMLAEDAFGSAGRRIVVEQFLVGEEASFIALVDGVDVLPLASSQDHKARDDGDRGPNTGGMGAYSPAPIVDETVHERIMTEVIRPTVEGLAAEEIHYRGFLYAGLMIAADGTPFVLEYNCRCGDPETQPIMMRLRSDLAELCNAAVDGRLRDVAVEWDPRAALCVVLAAGGYPGSYERGKIISGLGEDPKGVKVFHAATINGPNGIQTNGGRVLGVCALGDTVGAAQTAAYARAARIAWEGMHYRRDIGYRAVQREASTEPPVV